MHVCTSSRNVRANQTDKTFHIAFAYAQLSKVCKRVGQVVDVAPRQAAASPD
jgi:hypothetical protein